MYVLQLTRTCVNLILKFIYILRFSVSQEKVKEGVVEKNQAVPEEVDETKAIEKTPEDARNSDEKPTTSEKPERNEVETELGDDVVLGSESVPEEGKEHDATTRRSDETHGDDPVQQDKITKDVEGNVVVV